MNVSKNVPFLKSVVLTLVSLVCTLNLFAKDINSDADWASVTASDEVVIKMSGTTTIPSDITCKKISFDRNYTTLNLNGHTLTIENMYMSNREGIKITNGGTVHATNVFEFKTKGGSINANIIADQDFRMSDQESMSIIGNVTVGKDFYMQSKNGSVTGDVIVGGKFYMNNQENMSVNGNVSANGGFVMQSKNGSVTGNVVVSHGDIEMTNQESMSIGGSINVSGNFNIQSKNVQVGGPGATIEVGGNLNMTNQENMDIEGDVSVEGDVTMQTKGGSITGNVSVGGNLNMTNQENMKIDGDVAVEGNLTISGKGSNISGTAAVGGNTNTSNGATITGGTTGYTGPISGGEEPSGEEPEGETPSGEEPSGEETLEYTVTITNGQGTENISSVMSCNGKYYVTFNPSQWTGPKINIKIDGAPCTYNVEGKIGNTTFANLGSGGYGDYSRAAGLNDKNELYDAYCIVDTKNKKVIFSLDPPNCGLDVPPIYSNKTSICLQDIKDGNLSAPSISGAKTQTWKVNGSSVDNLTNVKVGDIITYCVTDNNNVESCAPNSLTVQDKPYIDPMSQISFCSGSSINLPTIKTNGSSLIKTNWFTYNSSNVQSSYTEGSPVASDVTKFSYDVENACGSIQGEASVVVSDKPVINSMTIDAICEGGSFDLQANVSENNSTTKLTWERATSSSGTYSTFTNSNIPYSYNSNYIRLTAENDCGSVTSTKQVTVNPKPQVSIKKNPVAVCPGVAFDFTGVVETTGANTGKWVYKNNGADFSNTGLPYSANGTQLQYSATNNCGTTTSEPITLTVKPNTPEFTVLASGNSVMESLGGSSSSVTYTITKENECNSDDLEVTLSDDNFTYSINDNKVTVSLKDGLEIGTYETKVKFDIGTESKEKTLNGLVAEYPKTFILKKICGGTESDYPVTTDENGKLNIQLHSDDNCEYINEGTIECTEFTLTTSANDHFSGKFVNKGTIKADKIYYGTSSKKLGGSDAVYFDCGGTFIANDLEMNFNTITTSLKGTFLINNSFYIAPAQGQNFEISKCTEIKTYSTDINVSGGSMEISIHGHVNTEYFDVNIPNITSYDDAIITVGHLEASNLNLVISESSLLNLCTNPTKGAPDNIGYIYGTVMYLSDESTGWVDDITPITEGDLNHNDNSSAYWTTKNKYGEPIAKEVIPAYKSYKDCIDEKADPSLLGMDDDPFLPKDKEIRGLYNCNPCSKDFEDAKMEIREIHGKTFRLINGELIYCENDN